MNSIPQDIKTIWIIGLSSSGKTTLARLLIKKLQENGYPCLIIDGSEARNLFDTKLGFDPESRRKQTTRIRNLALWATGQKIIPVVALIHPFEDDRIKCRKELEGYCEVYLKCDLAECIKRDDKNVYAPAIEGREKFVVGLDIPYDEPVDVELILDSDKLSPDALLDILWQNLKNHLYNNRLTISAPATGPTPGTP
jgi:adenylylsulfate kinase-like enzyme